jgi:hypothetical protein
MREANTSCMPSLIARRGVMASCVQRSPFAHSQRHCGRLLCIAVVLRFHLGQPARKRRTASSPRMRSERSRHSLDNVFCTKVAQLEPGPANAWRVDQLGPSAFPEFHTSETNHDRPVRATELV